MISGALGRGGGEVRGCGMEGLGGGVGVRFGGVEWGLVGVGVGVGVAVQCGVELSLLFVGGMCVAVRCGGARRGAVWCGVVSCGCGVRCGAVQRCGSVWMSGGLVGGPCGGGGVSGVW